MTIKKSFYLFSMLFPKIKFPSGIPKKFSNIHLIVFVLSSVSKQNKFFGYKTSNSYCFAPYQKVFILYSSLFLNQDFLIHLIVFVLDCKAMQCDCSRLRFPSTLIILTLTIKKSFYLFSMLFPK